MNILSLSGVSKTLGEDPLFEKVTLGIDAGDKIGFVGKNGSGKSTFLRLLGGELDPDDGDVSRNRELTMSSVEQRPSFTMEMTLEDYVLRSADRQLRPETEDGAAVIHTFRSYCRELGLPDTGVAMATLSGGMIRKASLARALAFGSSFLTLDEPTNHLDIDTIIWLESLLKNGQFGFVLVTHDRYFLDSVCTFIMEIEGRQIFKYPGNYSSYLERKAARADIAERSERRRISILRGELQWLKRGPRARTGKDKSRKLRVQNLMDSGVQKEISMREFSSTHRRLGKKVLELHGVSKRYDGREVVSPFSYQFRRGERIGIIGPNGSGKTTFLRIVSEQVAPDGGKVIKGENTVFAYLDQTGTVVDGKMTVIDYMSQHADRIRLDDGLSVTAEQFLERFLFPRAMFSLPLERLSGGEFRRLYLIRILAASPNFLLLDEPTNDLDIETIRLLEDYLANFEGCILLVSHDRALLDRLTDYLFVFDGNGGIRGFVGSYEDYQQMIADERAQRGRSEGMRTASVPADPKNRAQRREKSLKLSFKERQEYELLLSEIAALEDEQRALEASFQQAVQDSAGLETRTRRYRAVQEGIEEKLARWEELGARAAE